MISVSDAVTPLPIVAMDKLFLTSTACDIIIIDLNYTKVTHDSKVTWNFGDKSKMNIILTTNLKWI